MPTRVIGVGSLDEPEQHATLLESRGMSGRYLYLSHRWEKNPRFRTLRSNLQHSQQALPMDQASHTFRDAIEVTRQLGFRHLWTYSLCIVQDDENDWMLRSQKMGNIFESSTCMIAAVDVLGEDGIDRGLFLPRDCDPLAVRLALPYEKAPLAAFSERLCKKYNRKKYSRVYIWKLRWLV